MYPCSVSRVLKPFIKRDTEIQPLKVKLLQEIIAYPHRYSSSFVSCLLTDVPLHWLLVLLKRPRSAIKTSVNECKRCFWLLVILKRPWSAIKTSVNECKRCF